MTERISGAIWDESSRGPSQLARLRRQWPRAVLLIGLGAIMFLIGAPVYRKVRAVQVLEQAGALVLCEWRPVDDMIHRLCPEWSAVPRWPAVVGEPWNVQVVQRGLPDEAVAALVALPNVRMLWIFDGSVTEEGLQILATAPAIRRLSISSSTFSDQDLEPLARIKTLEWLEVNRTSVTKEGIEWFRQARPDCRVTTDVR